MLAAALAGALAGCGGSSETRIPGSTPSGAFTSYAGTGFSLSVPSGWSRNAAGPTADGRTIVIWTPASGSARVDVEYYAGTRLTIAQLLDELKQSQKYVAANLKVSSLSVAAARVPGASAAKLVTERGSSTNGPHLAKVLFVRTHSGRLIYITASRFAGNAGFDPTQVINSFSLTRSA